MLVISNKLLSQAGSLALFYTGVLILKHNEIVGGFLMGLGMWSMIEASILPG